MGESGENIFSWRKELRSLSREQRVYWFYNQKLLPSLRETVTSCEQARQRGESSLIEQAWRQWARPTEVSARLEKIRQREERFRIDLSQKRDDCRVGLVGLGRIRHVDANSAIKRGEGKERQKRRIKEVEELYSQIDLNSLPPRTIDGGAINWPIEVCQDKLNTLKILGKIEEAIALLDQVIESAFNDVLGAASGLSVLYARRAKLGLQGDDLITSVQLARMAHFLQPNNHRLATLSLWGLLASFSQEYQFSSWKKRLKLAFLSSIALISISLTDLSIVKSVINQHLRENKPRS